MIKSLITEYGLTWVFNRSLYSVKLKLMKTVPSIENIFERTVRIERVDIIDVDSSRIERFLLNLPDKKKNEIITIADRAVEGKIRAFSSIEFDYLNPINWHYNPKTQAEVDRKLKWYMIPDFDLSKGDIKVIWEASRFTHFFYFTRAYLITKEMKYYYAFSEQLKSWIANNKYSFGVNYKCGQEATLRMINTLMAYSVFKSCGCVRETDEENIRELIEGSYKKVLSNFFYAHKCIKNNHTLTEITGLIIGAWCSNDTDRLAKAYSLLNKEIYNQFLKDGGYIQYSFNYQRYALQIIELVLKISVKTKLDLSINSKNTINNSIILMYQMQDDSGDVPNYGSNDGAQIFPVTSCEYRDYRPVLNTLYALINGKKLFKAGEYDEELLWFGKEEIDEYTISEIKRESIGYFKSGFYSLRRDAGYLMTILQDFKSRPSQMDQLHIDIWHKGKNIFCDSGTYSYASDIGKAMSLTSAHNAVKVQNKEQMKKHGPFLIYDWTESKDVDCGRDYFIGTMISKNGYSHMRSIKQTSSGYLIEDTLNGDINNCEFNFHTPCEARIIDNGFELLHNDSVIAKVACLGNIEVKKALRSLYYLETEVIDCVCVVVKTETRHLYIRFEIQLF